MALSLYNFLDFFPLSIVPSYTLHSTHCSNWEDGYSVPCIWGHELRAQLRLGSLSLCGSLAQYNLCMHRPWAIILRKGHAGSPKKPRKTSVHRRICRLSLFYGDKHEWNRVVSSPSLSLWQQRRGRNLWWKHGRKCIGEANFDLTPTALATDSIDRGIRNRQLQYIANSNSKDKVGNDISRDWSKEVHNLMCKA